MSSGSPIQTDTETLVSPVESVNTHLMLGSCSPVLLFPQGSIDIHKAIPYSKTTLAWVDGSIGNTFIRSLDDRTRLADKVTCCVRGRGGQEMMFWDTQEVLTLADNFHSTLLSLLHVVDIVMFSSTLADSYTLHPSKLIV